MRTAEGAGVCVGRPVERHDRSASSASATSRSPPGGRSGVAAGEIGEIVVQGPVVTRVLFQSAGIDRAGEDRRSGHGGFWHRMGDVGYLDEQGRVWFCGRKSQRVVTPERDAVHHPLRGGFQRPSAGVSHGPGRRARPAARAGAVRRARRRTSRDRRGRRLRSELLALGAGPTAHAAPSRRSCFIRLSRWTSGTTPRFSARNWRSGRRGGCHERPGHRRRRLPRRRHRRGWSRAATRCAAFARPLSRAGRARRRADPGRSRRRRGRRRAAARAATSSFTSPPRPASGAATREYYRANVVGTENVLAACRQHGVRRLVYTSSPSVVFNGRDMEGVDESVPYPNHYDAAYPQTKADGRAAGAGGQRRRRWRRWRCGRT